VKADNNEVTLSRTEFRLLAALAEHAGRVLTREELMAMIWNDATASTIRAVDVHIARLRAKLGEAGGQIRTISGLGYTMDSKPS
jgi:DNA-binding response OmpR family regulator